MKSDKYNYVRDCKQLVMRINELSKAKINLATAMGHLNK